MSSDFGITANRSFGAPDVVCVPPPHAVHAARTTMTTIRNAELAEPAEKKRLKVFSACSACSAFNAVLRALSLIVYLHGDAATVDPSPRSRSPRAPRSAGRRTWRLGSAAARF